MAHAQMSRYYFGFSFWNKINSVTVVNGERGAVSSGRISSRRAHFILLDVVLCWGPSCVWHRFHMGPLSLPLREAPWHLFSPDVLPHHNLAVPVPHRISSLAALAGRQCKKVGGQLYSCQLWQWVSSCSWCIAAFVFANRRYLYI